MGAGARGAAAHHRGHQTAALQITQRAEEGQVAEQGRPLQVLGGDGLRILVAAGERVRERQVLANPGAARLPTHHLDEKIDRLGVLAGERQGQGQVVAQGHAVRILLQTLPVGVLCPGRITRQFEGHAERQVGAGIGRIGLHREVQLVDGRCRPTQGQQRPAMAQPRGTVVGVEGEGLAIQTRGCVVRAAGGGRIGQPDQGFRLLGLEGMRPAVEHGGPGRIAAGPRAPGHAHGPGGVDPGGLDPRRRVRIGGVGEAVAGASPQHGEQQQRRRPRRAGPPHA